MSSPGPDDEDVNNDVDVNNFLAAIGKDDSPAKTRSKSIRISSTGLNGEESLVPFAMQPVMAKGKSGKDGPLH